jgi:hypothetical protein
MASSKAAIVTLLLTCKKVPTGKAESLQPAADPHSEMRQTAIPLAHNTWAHLRFRRSGSQYLHPLQGHHPVSTLPRP